MREKADRNFDQAAKIFEARPSVTVFAVDERFVVPVRQGTGSPTLEQTRSYEGTVLRLSEGKHRNWYDVAADIAETIQ